MRTAFKVGDKAVHPLRGVGEVTGFENRQIAGNEDTYYVLHIIEAGKPGRLMVPTRGPANTLRTVMTKREADDVLKVFRVGEKSVGGGPWNRRQRAYNEMMNSGSPHEIAKVLRDLYAIKFRNEKDLSFGERKLMDQAKSRLFPEIALAKKTSESAVEQEIEALFHGPVATPAAV